MSRADGHPEVDRKRNNRLIAQPRRLFTEDGRELELMSWKPVLESESLPYVTLTATLWLEGER